MRPAFLAIFLCVAAQAATVTLTVTSGNGQFPGKTPGAFGPVTEGTLTLNLTPNVAQNFLISQFSGFRSLDTFPPTPGATTTFQQTITVNGVSQTITRTLTIVDNGSCVPSAAGGGYTQIAGPAAAVNGVVGNTILTFDLGATGKVDV